MTGLETVRATDIEAGDVILDKSALRRVASVQPIPARGEMSFLLAGAAGYRCKATHWVRREVRS